MPVEEKPTPLAPSEVGKIVEKPPEGTPPAKPDAAKPAEPPKENAAPPADKKWAGKYANTDELAKGLRHMWKHAGLGELPDSGELWGEGKQWKTAEEAERGYANAERLYRQVKAAEQPSSILDEPAPKQPAKPDAKPEATFQDVPLAEVLARAQVSQADLERAVSDNSVDEALLETFRRAHPSLSQTPKELAYPLIEARMKLEVREVQELRTKAVEIAGSKDALKAMRDAIDDVVPEAERPGLKAALATKATALVAVRALKTYYDQAVTNGKGPQPVTGTSPAQGGPSEEDFQWARKSIGRLAAYPDSADYKRAFNILNNFPLNKVGGLRSK